MATELNFRLTEEDVLIQENNEPEIIDIKDIRNQLTGGDKNKKSPPIKKQTIDLDEGQDENEDEGSEKNKDNSETESTIEVDKETVLTHTKILIESGLIMLPDDFNIEEASIDQIYEKDYEMRNQAVLNAIVEQMPEELKDVVEYGLKGGKDIKGFLEKIKDDYTTIETVDEAVEYLKKFYKEAGRSERAIAKILDADDEELLSLANDLIEDERKQSKEKITKLKQQELEKVEEDKKKIQQYRASIKKTIESQPWDPTTKNKIYDYINKGDLSKTINEIISNPDNVVILASLLADSYTDGKLTLKRIENRVAGTQAKSLKERIDMILSTTPNPGGSTGTKIDPTKYKLNVDL